MGRRRDGHCRPGALVALGPAVTGGLVNEAVLAVLSEALPSRAVSPYARLISPLIVGRDLETDGVYVYPSFCSAAGAGAVAGHDGYQSACEGGTLGVVGKTDAEEEMARDVYKVVIDPETFEIDHAATESLRQKNLSF
jgi:hypothetical protein